MSTKAVLTALCKHQNVQEEKSIKYGILVFERTCKDCGKTLEPEILCKKCSGEGKQSVLEGKETGFMSLSCSSCRGTGRGPYNEFPKEWER